MRNRYYEEAFRDSIGETCREARKEGIVPTHVGIHPEDWAHLEYSSHSSWKHRKKPDYEWHGLLRYYYPVKCYSPALKQDITTSRLGEVQGVKDARVPEGQARVCDAKTAFILGYTDSPGSDLEKAIGGIDE